MPLPRGQEPGGLAAAGRETRTPARLPRAAWSKLAGPFACGFSYLWRPLMPLPFPTHRYGVYLACTNHSGLIR